MFLLFLEVVLYCYKLPSWNRAFAASHRFWVVMFSLSFVGRTFLIFFLIPSLTVAYLEMCYLISMCLCFLQFCFCFCFHVIYIYSHSIFVGGNASYNFSFLKFTEVWFVTKDMVYLGGCTVCTWEEGVFFCIWMECPKDINKICLI